MQLVFLRLIICINTTQEDRVDILSMTRVATTLIIIKITITVCLFTSSWCNSPQLHLHPVLLRPTYRCFTITILCNLTITHHLRHIIITISVLINITTRPQHYFKVDLSITNYSSSSPYRHHSITTPSPSHHHTVTTPSLDRRHTVTTPSPHRHYHITTTSSHRHHPITTPSPRTAPIKGVVA